ncbi:stage III sporulation protein AH [Priestia flexa]|uniref:stage III sporulation protein AH n=1 Tax=Priestia flexa TaxID=86664 RepID=UPI00211ABA85
MLMITEDVKGKKYKALIDLLLRHCDRFAFVENRQLIEYEEEWLAYINNLTEGIAEHFIERKIQQEWETTKLSEGSAYVFYYHFNNSTKQFLNEYSNSLFNWISPDLPEDLQFYRDDTCMLAVCSHEGFFLVDESLWEVFD